MATGREIPNRARYCLRIPPVRQVAFRRRSVRTQALVPQEPGESDPLDLLSDLLSPTICSPLSLCSTRLSPGLVPIAIDQRIEAVQLEAQMLLSNFAGEAISGLDLAQHRRALDTFERRAGESRMTRNSHAPSSSNASAI